MKQILWKNSKLVLLFFVLGAFILSISGCKKDNDTEPESEILALVTNGTIVPVTTNMIKGTLFIVDQSGKPITGITSANVSAKLQWVTKSNLDSAYVNGVVAVSSNQQSGLKVAAAITMDYSGSMQTYATTIPSMEHGVKTFTHSMAPGDLGEIIKFSDQVFVPQPFTSDTAALNAGVDNNNFNLYGVTALYQSIYQGLYDASALDSTKYMRSVIGFTDGGENASYISKYEMLNYAIGHGIPVHTIGFWTSSTDTVDLKDIAESTGGFFFLADNDSTFAKIYSTISGQLKNSYSYTVTWPGTLPPSGTWVKASVTTTYQGKKSTFARSFYLP